MSEDITSAQSRPLWGRQPFVRVRGVPEIRRLGTSALSNLRDPTCPPAPSGWGGWFQLRPRGLIGIQFAPWQTVGGAVAVACSGIFSPRDRGLRPATAPALDQRHSQASHSPAGPPRSKEETDADARAAHQCWDLQTGKVQGDSCCVRSPAEREGGRGGPIATCTPATVRGRPTRGVESSDPLAAVYLAWLQRPCRPQQRPLPWRTHLAQ